MDVRSSVNSISLRRRAAARRVALVSVGRERDGQAQSHRGVA
jgi:hypothetical protein